jgi:amidase
MPRATSWPKLVLPAAVRPSIATLSRLEPSASIDSTTCAMTSPRAGDACGGIGCCHVEDEKTTSPVRRVGLVDRHSTPRTRKNVRVDPVDLAFSGLVEQAKLLRQREISSPELVSLYLERIDRFDGDLRSFTHVRGAALEESRAAQAGLQDGAPGALLGVPVAVKDNIDVAGEVTSYGTGAVTRRAERDAEAVRRLRDAGAIILGKTAQPELALWTHFTESQTWGVTRNPWDPRRTPGGSSGGSAVAVAAGLVGGAIGSDGGGSIRVPAACCGIFGLKPQRGRIPLTPEREHWHGLGVLGPMARSVSDAAALFDAIADPIARTRSGSNPTLLQAATRDPGQLRIAFSLEPTIHTTVTDPVGETIAQTVQLLRDLGHRVAEHDPDYGNLRPLIIPRLLRGIHDDLDLLDDARKLERRTRRVARAGRFVSARRLERARGAEPARAARINAIFTEYDVLVTPVIAQPPPLAETWSKVGLVRNALGSTPWITYTQVWNLTGQPAAAVPVQFAASGLPLAVQLVARPGDEATIISLAAQIETARPWADHRPPLAAA